VARRLALRLVLLAPAVLWGTGCSTNPATGRLQFNTMDREEEIRVGEEAMPGLVAEYGGTYPSPQLAAYVTEIGMKLASQVEDADKQALPWEFTVLDSEVINAFALPGGKVFISVGLLREFTSEAELAGVLGHEVGHVTAEHAEERMGQAATASVLGQAAVAAASVLGGDPGITQAASVLVGTGGQGFLLKFSRDQESEADVLGVRYMIQAGYDPEGLIEVMTILKQASEGGETMEMLSTHPYPETRLKRITALLETSYPGQRGNPALTMGRSAWETRAKPYLPKGAGPSNGKAFRPPPHCPCGSPAHLPGPADARGAPLARTTRTARTAHTTRIMAASPPRA
jgi:predicted Zn-dependent protease